MSDTRENEDFNRTPKWVDLLKRFYPVALIVIIGLQGMYNLRHYEQVCDGLIDRVGDRCNTALEHRSRHCAAHIEHMEGMCLDSIDTLVIKLEECRRWNR